jgi:hypothetical protein
MVTAPVARRMAGVFAAFLVKVTVIPEGILIVVKLNTPLGGRASVVLLAGLKAPSVPVLPLVNVWAAARATGRPRSAMVTRRLPTRPMQRAFISLPPYGAFSRWRSADRTGWKLPAASCRLTTTASP